MMRARQRLGLAAAIAALLAFAWSASAQPTSQTVLSLTPPLTADTSHNLVEIRSNFTGAQLLIFGAQNQPGELVIVVRGPSAGMQIWRKERVGGLWLQTGQKKFSNVPEFYAIASARPITQIASAETLTTLGIGLPTALRDGYDQALARLLVQRHWWQPQFSQIEYFGESLFKIRLEVPDTLPEGEYTAEVYLFNAQALQAVQFMPLTVYKTGLEATIDDGAKHAPLWYGLTALFLSLLGGWLAHRLFGRR